MPNPVNNSNWKKKIETLFDHGLYKVIPEFTKTLVILRFWFSIAVMGFIVFLFGFLFVIYKIFVH